jgi:hypothetical protein
MQTWERELMGLEEEDNYDAFAAARLADSFKILEERQNTFEVSGHKHEAYQDLSGGGTITEVITVTWRVKRTNGQTFGPGKTPG